MIIFILLAKIFTIIPLQENIAISLVDFPEWEINMDNGIVLIKKVLQSAKSFEYPSIARIYSIAKEYQIDFNGYSLYRAEHDDEVVGKFFDMGDKGFYFQIFATENGQIIKSNEKCLSKGKWNDNLKGYHVIAEDCNNNTWEHWEIKRVPLIVKDNDEKNAAIFVYERDFRFMPN
ncbi:hypothetical protein H312_02487 [Anncaliia algerae PRA339]|uniref:Ricin B lectin domain-containing protein n=1 Tax=Anncaliia algerae PRA339 TaxID=1288291 RepID=A0A059EYZ6_9MICR|nr:hypothetical protein H312_02487 [Anncaliia algerae PRA339]